MATNAGYGRKIRKFFYRNILLAISAFLLAAVAVLFIVISLKMETSPIYRYAMQFRGSAIETTGKELSPAVFDEDSYIFIETRNEGEGYVNRGDEDVVLMRFDLTSKSDTRLMGVNFKADERDFKNLQIYFDDQYVDEAPVYQGGAVFSDLWIKLGAGVKNEIVVKGVIASSAQSGDVVRISINDVEDISITGDLAKSHDVEFEFPLKGRTLRIIGDKIRF